MRWLSQCAGRLRMSGLSAVCSSCMHGGHAEHMREWFAKYDVCPSGCGCKCSFMGCES